MASASARIFLVRHGETDWIVGGKHNSRTEVPLSKTGEREVDRIQQFLVGPDALIDPQNVARVYCSPRCSARRTVELLELGIHNHQHFYDRESNSRETTGSKMRVETAEPNIQVTPCLQEWDYGDYEGLTLRDIHQLRQKQAQEQERQEWNIWRDGCPGGSMSPKQVSDRLDSLIQEIKSFIEKSSTTWPSGQIEGARSQQAQDIVCVGHGHVLAALALRWVGSSLMAGHMRLIFEPGGVAVLGYEPLFHIINTWHFTNLYNSSFEHDNPNHPAILVGRKPGKSDRTL
ncbi:hypothetical protein NUU61_002693 [Penicillium alfredii]|uniref:Uncharacterized protein n=1 Tax=Penicillium alfredii TaxID=1506179 RepID=A0A9W9KGU6_9EURO|nr:uncharacterized protein NUU61_002693 [Penicillium alfredii]KAJ5105346.1 hypothetical protein NUU61_002693 [Penicillium alfredii]